MTEYRVKFNGTDISALVDVSGYFTDLQAVSRTYTDLALVDHEIVVRYRGVLKLSFNAMTQAEAVGLCELLANQPLTVEYYSIQRGRYVEETMRAGSFPVAHLLEDSGEQWVQLPELYLTQL